MTVDTKFLAADTPYGDAVVVIAGVPFDSACSFRAGARHAPQMIRSMSHVLEEYSVYQDKSLLDAPFYDAGDIEGMDCDIDKAHAVIGKAVCTFLDDGKIPLLIGGDHSITIPIVREFHSRYGDSLVIVHIDAHADFRDGYQGCDCSHASVIKRISDFMPSGNIHQFGIRSGSREELTDARNATNLYLFEVLKYIRSIPDLPGNPPVYLTIDIDVLDPAYANGTGTPEPCGISTVELLKSVLALKRCRLIGMDIVEVSPPYDNSGRTAAAAALIIREAVLLMANHIIDRP